MRYYSYYSNRSRGARNLAEHDDAATAIVIDEPPADTRRKTSWVRLIQKVYEVDRLECANSGATMRIIALIDDPATCGSILYPMNVRSWPLADCRQGTIPIG